MAEPVRVRATPEDTAVGTTLTGSSGATVRVTVRLFAGARAAAGTSQAVVEVAGGVQDALDALTRAHPGVARVLPACSYLLDGVAARPGQGLGGAGACTLDVLPPFSGG